MGCCVVVPLSHRESVCRQSLRRRVLWLAGHRRDDYLDAHRLLVTHHDRWTLQGRYTIGVMGALAQARTRSSNHAQVEVETPSERLGVVPETGAL